MYINVVFLNMNHKIHEQVTKNHDGGYTIILNARDSRSMHEKTYRHALRHIERNDFDKHDVQNIEYYAHLD